MIKGIPTKYQGRLFRSRLEARWAAFFDRLNWRWEYEPFDMDGWIPDFVLLGENDVLVEVKPVTERPRDVAEKLTQATKGSKWDKSTDETRGRGHVEREDLLILGASIGPDLNFGNACSFGWFVQGGNSVFSRDVKGFDFFDNEMSYHHRIHGTYEGDNHLDPIPYPEMRHLWNEAGNEVQWKSPSRK